MLLYLLIFVLTALHLRLTKTSLKASLKALRKDVFTQPAVELVDKYEEERLRMQVLVFGLLHGFATQICFPAFLVALCCFLEERSAAWLMLMAPLAVSYSVHCCIEAGLLAVETRADFHSLRALCTLVFGIWYCAIALQSQLDALCLIEVVWCVAMILAAFVFFQYTLLVPIHLAGAALLIYKRFELAAVDHFSSSLVCAWLSVHTCVFFGVVASTYAIQRHIMAKVVSDSHASYLGAFRTVLNGVSDGGVVLSLGDFRMLEDASSIERLLKRPGLANTSFLELLLDTASRQGFVEFLQSENVSQGSSVPPGLKISLQGSEGPVSLDIFCTRGDGYYLCALKEEPGQYPVPPDAADANPVIRQTGLQAPGSSTSSGKSQEVVTTFSGLVQALLLVNNETHDLDVEEVTLSFCRRSRRDRLPTLRQFVRVNDWERLQPIFQKLGNLEPNDEAASIKLQSSLRVRVPGSYDNYLYAKDACLSLADEMGQGRIQTFQIALSNFASYKSRKSEGTEDMESINED